MNISPIRNEMDYQMALKRLEVVFDAKKGTEEGDELEVISILIDQFEKENFPIDKPDPIEAIKFRMEQLGLDENTFIGLVGLGAQAKDIFDKKRKLTLGMIRKISSKLQIPAEVPVQEY